MSAHTLSMGTIAIALLVIAAHAGLINTGQWETDEYQVFSLYHAEGLIAVAQRVVTWSPRPASELLLYGYSNLAAYFKTPLVGGLLTFCWLLLPLAAFAGLRCVTPADGHPPKLLLLMLLTSLLALLLLGHHVGELFYWPQASAAYLPTLAALLFLLVYLLLHHTPNISVMALPLCLAALSSEMGAMFTLCYCLLTLPDARRHRKGTWWFPFWCSVGVMLLLLVHRATSATLRLDGDIRHHPLTSFWQGTIALLVDIFIPDDLNMYGYFGFSTTPAYAGTSLPTFLPLITAKILFFLGFRMAWRSCLPFLAAPALVKKFILALIAASAASLIASEYVFGGICCDRHESLRQCFYILALAGLAVLPLFPRSSLLSAASANGAALLLSTSMLILLLPRLPELAEDYRHYDRFVSARNLTWKSGYSEGRNMLFHHTPHARAVHDTQNVVEQWGTPPSSPVATYFGKESAAFIASP